MSEQYSAFEFANHISEDGFKQAMSTNARWVLRAGSKDTVFENILQFEGVPYRAWNGIRKVFVAKTALRRNEMKAPFLMDRPKGSEDPYSSWRD